MLIDFQIIIQEHSDVQGEIWRQTCPSLRQSKKSVLKPLTCQIEHTKHNQLKIVVRQWPREQTRGQPPVVHFEWLFLTPGQRPIRSANNKKILSSVLRFIGVQWENVEFLKRTCVQIVFADGQINFDSLEERLRGVYLSESVIGVGCWAGALLMPKDSIVKCNN